MLNKVPVPKEVLEEWKSIEEFLERTYQKIFDENANISSVELKKIFRESRDKTERIFKKLESVIYFEYMNKIDELKENKKDSDYQRQRDIEEYLISSGGAIYYRVYFSYRVASGSYGFSSDDKEQITEYGICTSFEEAVELANKYDDGKFIHDFHWDGEKYLWSDPTSQWCSQIIYIAIHLTIKDGEVIK